MKIKYTYQFYCALSILSGRFEIKIDTNNQTFEYNNILAFGDETKGTCNIDKKVCDEIEEHNEELLLLSLLDGRNYESSIRYSAILDDYFTIEIENIGKNQIIISRLEKKENIKEFQYLLVILDVLSNALIKNCIELKYNSLTINGKELSLIE